MLFIAASLPGSAATASATPGSSKSAPTDDGSRRRLSNSAGLICRKRPFIDISVSSPPNRHAETALSNHPPRQKPRQYEKCGSCDAPFNERQPALSASQCGGEVGAF